MKQCFKCKETKPLNEFYKHAGMADGHLNKCKVCTRLDASTRRFGSKREEVLAYDRARANEPQRKQKHLERSRVYSMINKKKRSAQGKLYRAVKTGIVKQMPCLVCGDKSEAHHPDYDRPLEVVWLCSAHHKQAHAVSI